MSFSFDIKTKLANREIDDTALAEAELYAAVVSASRLILRGGGRISLRFSFTHPACVKRLYLLLKEVFGLRATLSTSEVSAFGAHRLYSAEITETDEVKKLLGYFELTDEVGSLISERTIKSELLPDEGAKRAFIRGMLLFCGYVAEPKKNYLCQFTLSNQKTAESFCRLLNIYDIMPKIRSKNNDIIVYIKRAELVAKLLALADVGAAYFKLNDAVIMKQLRNDSRRAANCDMANAEKAEQSSNAQVSAIEKLIRCGVFPHFSEKLIGAAQLRLDNPGASLKELCKMSDPPLAKSTLNNRFLKLIEIADGTDEIKKEGNK